MLLISAVVLGIICLIQSYFLYKFASTILAFEEKIETVLDGVDDSYKIIGEILERPLFYDSPEVREVHRQIGYIYNYLLDAASGLAKIQEDSSKEE